jgi:hypothetical protein
MPIINIRLILPIVQKNYALPINLSSALKNPYMAISTPFVGARMRSTDDDSVNRNFWKVKGIKETSTC